MKTKLIRKIQTVISILLFIGVFMFCWNVTKFKLTEIALSKWGVQEKVGVIWNLSLAILGLSIYWNVRDYIKSHKRLLYKQVFEILFFITCIALFLTGIINMNYIVIHNLTAVTYFFLYPLAIFLLAFINRKHMIYKEWFWLTVFSTSMIFCPLIMLKIFNGFAIPEITHSVIVILFNIWLLFDGEHY